MTRDQLQLAQQAVASVQVRETVADYVLRVVIATREHKSVALGASPRAALMWLRAAKSRAWLAGRDYVLPDDLKAMAQPVLAHRVFMHDGGSAAAVVATTLATVAVPSRPRMKLRPTALGVRGALFFGTVVLLFSATPYSNLFFY